MSTVVMGKDRYSCEKGDLLSKKMMSCLFGVRSLCIGIVTKVVLARFCTDSAHYLCLFVEHMDLDVVAPRSTVLCGLVHLPPSLPLLHSMTQTWTTAEEYLWLKERIPQWRQRRQRGQRFVPKTTSDFLLAFPTKLPRAKVQAVSITLLSFSS